MTPLIAVAHGSRDPRSARTMRAVAERVRAACPGLDVRLGFLDLSEPLLDTVIDDLAAAGCRRAVAVPLLLGDAYHSRVDLPALLAAAEARHPGIELRQAGVLGTDPRLVHAVRDRLAEAGAAPDDPGLGIALAAVGSSRPAANATARALAPTLRLGTRWAAVRTCFATTDPSVESATAALHAAGAARIAVGSWFLAPGLLTDRVRQRALEGTPDTVCAEPIGAHPLLAEVVLDRYRAALRDGVRRDAVALTA
ncbi:sirohydrochlorin chelatase [Rhodococcus sp. D2-41]|uniref:Sirohydrochlorin chelatase n=1 Tax=Speluncibacter jeojiensis TaxID=2710754 RepID=A0A9X4LW21_9ACTN|nr:sirohydrochlorin chelatase [Rhodococcus sp. D2-41]MDG3011832.1 sirohydrochlorin chelatase [Rhodococcus sp. D2-41]MDG3013284.1 sirohydrochlorin chelatase [Corynebacteriales bacterium D3-21]